MKFLICLTLLQILGAAGWLQKGYPWVRFAAAQLFQLEAMVIGWVVLIPFCLAQAWEMSPVPSIKDGTRQIDRWKWAPLQWVAGNWEDGVSGAQALVNGNQPYMPRAWAPWRAYCWSAWRNSCDSLKYRFAWSDGPFKQWTLFCRPQHAGWQLENGFKVPVISL